MNKMQKFNKKNMIIILWVAGIIIAFNYTIDYLGVQEYLKDILYILLTFVFGIPIVSRALSALRYKIVGIELLVSIAVIGALFIKEYSEAGMVTFLFQLGSFLEMRTLEKTRNSIRALTEMAPTTAILIRDNKQIEIDVDEVCVDDVLLVKTGAKVAVDGKIVRGEGYFDEASITGESKLAHKRINDIVFAGTILESGMVEMCASSVGEDTTFAKIINLVEEAQDVKSPVEKFIDMFAKWYTPFVAVFALIVGVISKDIPLAITVLVLACPGALVIGAPVASVAGIGKGAKQGVLLKGGDSIDMYAKSDVMVFDKTGTLTKGKFEVNKIAYFVEDTKYVDKMVALAESVSNHPIATAINEFVKSQQVISAHIHLLANVKGMGLHVQVQEDEIFVGNKQLMEFANISMTKKEEEALTYFQNTGATIIIAAINKKICAIYSIADTIKDDAKACVEKLKQMGIKKTILLSGDHQQSAEAVGKEIGMDEIHGGLLPQDKLAFVNELQSQGHTVTFVGDGINDSPALVSANIGIAMGSGTDVAIETSNIVLVKSTLSSLVSSFELAKRVVSVTRQNIVIAIGTVVFLIVGLFAGFIHMASGMFVHELSILVVIINAMRLLR